MAAFLRAEMPFWQSNAASTRRTRTEVGSGRSDIRASGASHPSQESRALTMRSFPEPGFPGPGRHPRGSRAGRGLLRLGPRCRRASAARPREALRGTSAGSGSEAASKARSAAAKSPFSASSRPRSSQPLASGAFPVSRSASSSTERRSPIEGCGHAVPTQTRKNHAAACRAQTLPAEPRSALLEAARGMSPRRSRTGGVRTPGRNGLAAPTGLGKRFTKRRLTDPRSVLGFAAWSDFG